MRNMIPSAGFAFALFATASVTHACAGHGPDDWISTIPGIGFYRPDVMLLLPILAGTIERPIYSAAGYRVATLGYSIQANLLAALAANALGAFDMMMLRGSMLMLFAVLLAPIIAVVVKYLWFTRVPHEDGVPRRVGPFVRATLLSTAVIITLAILMELFGTNRHAYAERTATLRTVAMVVVGVGAIVTHLYLFTTLRRGRPDTDAQRGFDVLLQPSAPAVAR